MLAYVRSAFDPVRQMRSVLVAAAAIYAVFVLIASVVASHEQFPPWPPGNPVRLLAFSKVTEASLPSGGFAYFSRADGFSAFEDTVSDAQKSPIILYENDKPLGPNHSVHYDIEKIGLGRYSHWKDIGILFATSDNTDPSKNGRAYFVVLPDGAR